MEFCLLAAGATIRLGTMALTLAGQRGAGVFAPAGTQRKVDCCRDRGAEVAINYREESFDARVRAETEGAGVDVILDNMGAAYLEPNIRSLDAS